MMDNPAVPALASLAVASLRDLAKSIPDHPAVPLLAVYVSLIEGAAEANDEDYLSTLLGLAREA